MAAVGATNASAAAHTSNTEKVFDSFHLPVPVTKLGGLSLARGSAGAAG
jgi:hypothetical protein